MSKVLGWRCPVCFADYYVTDIETLYCKKCKRSFEFKELICSRKLEKSDKYITINFNKKL